MTCAAYKTPLTACFDNSHLRFTLFLCVLQPVQDRQEELVVEEVAPVLIEEVILEEPRKDL